MSKELSTGLLSAIRAVAEVPGERSADDSGFSWHGWYWSSRLSFTANVDSQGMRIQILVDRTSSMVMTQFWTQFAVVMPTCAIIEAVDSYPELLAWTARPIAVFAAARA
jgi:hypothetical protein